jgi:hypothetical protein
MQRLAVTLHGGWLKATSLSKTILVIVKHCIVSPALSIGKYWIWARKNSTIGPHSTMRLYLFSRQEIAQPGVETAEVV